MTDQRLLGNLHSWGADPDKAIMRLSGDEEFYLGLVCKFASGLDYAIIDELLNKGDLDEAFMRVHRMKGSTADLCLTPLNEVLMELTEELRPKDHMPDGKLVEEFKKRSIEFLEFVPKQSKSTATI